MALLSFGGVAVAQEPELVRFEDLYFNSEFEKSTFTNFHNGHVDQFGLLLAVSPHSDKEILIKSNAKLQMEVEKIRDKKFAKLKDEKKIERIYEFVNDAILYQYKEETLFPEVFSKGTFNCLTASAFYGLFFENLGIPYEFKESSNHVHPVAFPESMQIKVETTDPISGFQYFDPRLKLQFVNYLNNAKIISKEEIDSVSIDNIFNKYYFPESSIGLIELAGLQYLNDAFYNFGKNKFNEAFRQIQKAYFLYPSNKVSTMMLFLLYRCLTETEYNSISDADYLIYASRFVGKELRMEDFLNELKAMTEKVLFRRSQTDLYYGICDYILANTDQLEIREAVEIEYYTQKGAILMSSFHIKEALSTFEKALVLEPENFDLQTLTLRCLAFSFGTSSNQEMVSSLEDFERRFPLMGENETFITFLMLGYLELSSEKFDFEKPMEGEALIKKFENLVQNHPGISIQYEKVGNAYSAAAIYYFKRNDKKNAKAFLNRGLFISPDNYQLMYRLRALD